MNAVIRVFYSLVVLLAAPAIVLGFLYLMAR